MYRYITLLCILCMGLPVRAQFGDATVVPLNHNFQLPSNEITCIFQDAEGYIWYGTTDGLCRYDGYGIHEFRKNIFHPEQVDVHLVAGIVQDLSGRLWVGTNHGLLRIDRKTFWIDRVDDPELEQSNIKYLISASDGSVWAMGTQHLYHIGNDMKQIAKYDMHEQITCLFEDSRQRIFVSRFGHGLMVLEPGSKNFRIVAPSYQISTMLEDTERHCYWMCDRNRGIIKMEYTGAGEQPRLTPQATVTDYKGAGITYFTHMVQDNRFHYIWAISYYRGLHVLNVNAAGMLDDISTSNLLPQENYIFNNIMKDNGGNLWITGIDTNSFIINFDNKRIKYDELDKLAQITRFAPSVVTLLRDRGRMFWVMQMRNNLWLYDADTDTWSDYAMQPAVAALPLYLTRRLIQSKQPNHVWAVTDHNVYLLGREGMQLYLQKAVQVESSAEGPDEITAAYEDTRQNLWIASGGCLYVVAPQNEELTRIGHFTGEISDFAEDKHGVVWCSVRNQGLMKLNPDRSTTLYPLDIDILTLTHVEPYIWIGTREGRVYRFDETQTEGSRFSDFTGECGIDGNQVIQMKTDCYGHLWIVGNQRVREYNPENGTSRTISTREADCRLTRFMPRSTFIDPTDSLVYIGGTPGFMTMAPVKSIDRQADHKQPQITNIVVAGNSVWFAPKNHETQEVTLEANAHNVTIAFSTLDIANQQNIRYAYKLDGVDHDWTELDAGQNTAIYNLLPKGRLLFHVKSTDTNGLWYDNETTLVIHRLPAWYETTLAYVIYVLLALLAIAAATYTYKRRLESENQKQLNDKITQAKIAYFTSISHELLTPLTIINLLASRLKAEPADESPKLIQANVTRLRRLLQQVLDFRKAESHNMKLYVEPANITELLKTLSRESFEPLATDKHIDFTTLLPTRDIEGYVDGDKVEKILFNLVSNAFKYTPENRKVTLKAETTALQLTLSVKDEGVGIDPREQKFIFNRFYSSKKNDNTISNGIGLSLTKELVELHHGTIDVKSQLNKGSEFTVRIPIDRNSYSDAEIREIQTDMQKDITPIQHNPKQQTHSMSLLMVEDNIELLAAMQEMLSEHYTVFIARDGIEALDIIGNEDIDIIVSDISMPRMNGIELCQHIKSDIKISHTVFVLLTAMTSTQTQVDAYDAGADAYLAKPFDTPVLLSLLANLMDRREKMQQHFQHTAMQAEAGNMEVSNIDLQFVQQAIHNVEHNISDSEYDVETLCSDMNMSRSTLTRKLKALTGQTPIQFIRSIRLKYAYRLLQNHTVNVADAMYRVGYNDQRSFTLAFKEMFGTTPGAIEKET